MRAIAVSILGLVALAPPPADAESDPCTQRRMAIESSRAMPDVKTRPPQNSIYYRRQHEALTRQSPPNTAELAETERLWNAARMWEQFDNVMAYSADAQAQMEEALAAANKALRTQQADIQAVRDLLRDQPRDAGAENLIRSTREKAERSYERIRASLADFDCFVEVSDFIARELDPRLARLRSGSKGSSTTDSSTSGAGSGPSTPGTSTGTSSPGTSTGTGGAPSVVGMRTQQAIDTLSRAGYGVSGIDKRPAPSAEQADTIFGQGAPSNGAVALQGYAEFKSRPAGEEIPSGRPEDLLGLWRGTARTITYTLDPERAGQTGQWSLLVVRREGKLLTNCLTSPFHGETIQTNFFQGTQAFDGGQLTCDALYLQTVRHRLVVQARGTELVGRFEELSQRKGQWTVYKVVTLEARRVDPHPADEAAIDE